MGNNIEWIGIFYKWKNSQSRDILDGVFLTNQIAQHFVLLGLNTQIINLANKLTMGHQKLRTALLITRVQDSSIWQNDSHRFQCAVTIGMRTATHARGIVHYNTTHHG